jgi:glycosyltransferase involved in cell wall biosynthesis
VRYHYQPNQGQASAKNAGIRLTNGDIVAFLDADDLWEPHKLERQLPLFDNPRVGVAYHCGRVIDRDGQPVHWVRPRTGYMVQRRGSITKWLAFENIVPFSSSAVRRSLLQEFGAFDESLRMGIDWDLWLRLSCRTEFDFHPELLYAYRLHGKQMSHNLEGRISGSDRIFEKFLRSHPNAFSRRDLREITFYNSCRRADTYRGIDNVRSRLYLLNALRAKPWSAVPYIGLIRNAVEGIRS